MKDARGREDDRENGTNGDDRKGLEDTQMTLQFFADLYGSY
jgi:hypothetical protein